MPMPLLSDLLMGKAILFALGLGLCLSLVGGAIGAVAAEGLIGSNDWYFNDIFSDDPAPTNSRKYYGDDRDAVGHWEFYSMTDGINTWLADEVGLLAATSMDVFSGDAVVIGAFDTETNLWTEVTATWKYSNGEFSYWLDHTEEKMIGQLDSGMLVFNVEIVLWRDKQNVVQGMEFVPIHSVCYWVGNNTCRFSGKTYEGKKEKFSIEKQYLIIFDLKDLGFHRKYFRRLMNRLGSLGSAVTSGLINDPNLNGIYNFTEHQKRMDYELLKSTKKIFWLGRNYSNQHLSESYLLYRSAQYKSLFFRFLTYCLEQINKGIDFFSSELGYAGHIKAKYSQPDYETALTRYWKGEINVTDLNNFITPIAHNAKAEI